MVEQGKNNGLFKGLAEHLVPGGLMILQYADDTIVCLEDNIESANNFKMLLCLYEMLSGMKINFDKCEIYH
jgi:hypothetical protein